MLRITCRIDHQPGRPALRRLGSIVSAILILASGAAVAGPKDDGKINSQLRALEAEHAAHVAQRSSLPFKSRNALARVVDDRVVIAAVADGDVADLKKALTTLGVQNVAVFGRVVSGELPIVAISALDGIANLRFAQPAIPRHRVGTVTSQGDTAMRAAIA